MRLILCHVSRWKPSCETMNTFWVVRYRWVSRLHEKGTRATNREEAQHCLLCLLANVFFKLYDSKYEQTNEMVFINFIACTYLPKNVASTQGEAIECAMDVQVNIHARTYHFIVDKKRFVCRSCLTPKCSSIHMFWLIDKNVGWRLESVACFFSHKAHEKKRASS